MSIRLFEVIKIYIEHVERLGDTSAKAMFPHIDDDNLSDSIAEYLQIKGIEYSLEKWREVYTEVQDHFRIYG